VVRAEDDEDITVQAVAEQHSDVQRKHTAALAASQREIAQRARVRA
jgi:hypothetical protein